MKSKYLVLAAFLVDSDIIDYAGSSKAIHDTLLEKFESANDGITYLDSSTHMVVFSDHQMEIFGKVYQPGELLKVPVVRK